MSSTLLPPRKTLGRTSTTTRGFVPLMIMPLNTKQGNAKKRPSIDDQSGLVYRSSSGRKRTNIDAPFVETANLDRDAASPDNPFYFSELSASSKKPKTNKELVSRNSNTPYNSRFSLLVNSFPNQYAAVEKTGDQQCNSKKENIDVDYWNDTDALCGQRTNTRTSPDALLPLPELKRDSHYNSTQDITLQQNPDQNTQNAQNAGSIYSTSASVPSASAEEDTIQQLRVALQKEATRADTLQQKLDTLRLHKESESGEQENVSVAVDAVQTSGAEKVNGSDGSGSGSSSDVLVKVSVDHARAYKEIATTILASLQNKEVYGLSERDVALPLL